MEHVRDSVVELLQSADDLDALLVELHELMSSNDPNVDLPFMKDVLAIAADKFPNRNPSPSSEENIPIDSDGLTPGERRLWDEQLKIKCENGERVEAFDQAFYESQFAWGSAPSSVNTPQSIPKGLVRKPKYLNRIKYGTVWTSYNKAHFSPERPPPPQIIGYRYNLFYPDLIDSLRAPTYRVERGQTPDEPSKLIFSSGRPYEDLEFTIVGRDWDTTGRSGFRCIFERGLLQLWFTFRADYVVKTS